MQKLIEKAPNSAAKKSAADLHKARITGAAVAYKQLKEANQGCLQHHQWEEFLKQYPGIALGMIIGAYYHRENASNGKKKPQSATAAVSPPGDDDPPADEEEANGDNVVDATDDDDTAKAKQKGRSC